jgi:aminopeptidase N
MERICEVTAHEIVHQWFGNLVTPSDWKYLWLNESFATYFGFGIVNHYYPAWGTWDQFIHGQTGTAMRRDALSDTLAIEIPGGEHVVINSATAPIIYNKGASILRQIREYIGDGEFQKGLRQFLSTHAYGNASSLEFWQAFESASDAPVAAIMRSWVEQPGFPVIECVREGSRLHLKQRRFMYLNGASDQHWHIPLRIDTWTGTGAPATHTHLMTAPQMTIDVDASVAAYKINGGQSGFYRVHYRDASNMQELEARTADKSLSPRDRWGLQCDLYELVKSGVVAPERYLSFTERMLEETDYLPLAAVADNLFDAFCVFPPSRRGQIEDLGRRLTGNALEAMGRIPADGEPHPKAMLRDQLIWQAVVYGREDIREDVQARFAGLQAGADVHADILKSTLQVGGYTGDADTFSWLTDHYHSRESEHERMNVLAALGAFQEEVLRASALDFGMRRIPDRIRFVLIGAVAATPGAGPVLWTWFRKHVDDLEAGHPILYERIVSAVIQAAGLDYPEDVRAWFEDYRQRSGAPKDAIALSLETLEINRRLRSAG